jgi:myo-inositol-1-phosphate synthase
MKLMLLLALLLVSPMAHSETEAKCIDQLYSKFSDKYTKDQFATNITVCSIKMMEGFGLYISGSGSDKIIRRLYPDVRPEATLIDKESVTNAEKADRLTQYNTCEEITSALANYMTKCTNKGK